ncbi:uncharacterized protein LOC111404409 [Olea europaea var. sylvestris]|uniref:uncharacterized protein LOC111404409 n=1 Tax=Olea europaea var. sylvestris TaxID=158386 RepID=UPI000C1D6284|nr:uncharacterized protein LOC111404409 [Olea europaea var. sylvestris]
MEVYVDDMLVKSLEAEDHITHLNSTFQILRRYRMRLSPLKYAFGVAFGKFLGYMVNQREIEANPEKIETLCTMRSPQKPKEVQSLTGQVAALSRFVSKATDKCLPFFKVLKVGKKFQWNKESEMAFQDLKRHLGQAPPSKPKPDEILQLYLVVSKEAISSVLTREKRTTQLPIYYTSKALISSETRYPDMEKLALALITASKKLRSYFQAHTVHVLTNFSLKTVIKGQALADFVAEFANLPKVDEIMEPVEPPMWNLFVDGLVGDADSGAKVVLISPEDHKLNSAVRFGVQSHQQCSRIRGTTCRHQNLRVENAHVDALSKLARSKDSELLIVVPIEHLLLPSTEAPNVMWVVGTPTWMQPIVAYLKDQILPTDKLEAYKLRRRSTHFLFVDDVLYKRSFSSPLLRCVGEKKLITY